MIDLSSAVMKHHFDELRSRLNIPVVQIFITHDLHVKEKNNNKTKKNASVLIRMENRKFKITKQAQQQGIRQACLDVDSHSTYIIPGIYQLPLEA